MSELPADRSGPAPGAASGARAARQEEAGDGRQASAPALPENARAGPMVAAGAVPMAAEGEGPMAVEGEGPMAAAEQGPMAAAAAAGGGPMAAAGRGPMAAAAAAAGEVPVAAAARDARMAEVGRVLAEPAEDEGPENRRRSRAGHGQGRAALPYLRLRHPLSLLGINYQQFLRHYLVNYPITPGRIQALEERRRRFVEACRAREAALDAHYQRNPQRMDFDILMFTIALTASEVINPLIEELGCDKCINRE
ncbi:EP300-interacting inhibitor of differentiation 2-like [Sorex fumeus]|uniref:EP300-interacting inhibitor of differentiation 2-like n=1 Tax=Sorex fumeus TaxID=62283 RepID=UPI0024AD2BF6|nr:EP300-interacting inhibitor of differentiation 2-like [Sorex fumeus]